MLAVEPEEIPHVRGDMKYRVPTHDIYINVKKIDQLQFRTTAGHHVKMRSRPPIFAQHKKLEYGTRDNIMLSKQDVRLCSGDDTTKVRCRISNFSRTIPEQIRMIFDHPSVHLTEGMTKIIKDNTHLQSDDSRTTKTRYMWRSTPSKKYHVPHEESFRKIFALFLGEDCQIRMMYIILKDSGGGMLLREYFEDEGSPRLGNTIFVQRNEDVDRWSYVIGSVLYYPCFVSTSV
jgi:hypothetical protein